MNHQELHDAIGKAAAIRRRRRLQPAGGPGDKIFPPTYPGDGNNSAPRHVYEVRRVRSSSGTEMESQVCVLIDSVQSQANRLEEALENASEAGRVVLPRIVVDFSGAGLNSIGNVSDLSAPHRIFDAILRDSDLEGQPFRESDLGKRLKASTQQDATAILEVSPASLLFGAWNSTGEGGGMGAKFQRAIVSEIVGVNVPVEEVSDRRTGEVQLRTAGRRTGSRIDPLGIVRAVDIYQGANGWDVNKEAAGKGGKPVRPSEINHGNIAPSVEPLGVTCDYAEQTSVISLAALRRLRFGEDPRKNEYGRAYLAALGLLALAEVDEQGYALRSRCDLVGDGPAPLQVVRADGSCWDISLSVEAALSLYREAFDAAKSAGFKFAEQPVRLTPQAKLVEIVRQSQMKALNDEVGPDEA